MYSNYRLFYRKLCYFSTDFRKNIRSVRKNLKFRYGQDCSGKDLNRLQYKKLLRRLMEKMSA